MLDLWDGDLEAADALAATHARDQPADRQPLGRVGVAPPARPRRALRGEHGRERSSSSQAALDIVVDGGAPYFELWVRPDLARALAELGRVQEAREHVDRCRAIVAGGEDWRGRAGVVALADAIVLAHEGRAADAERVFADGRAVLARHGLRGEEADAPAPVGPPARRRPSDSTRRPQLYRRHDAGRLWLERVAADRRRFG